MHLSVESIENESTVSTSFMVRLTTIHCHLDKFHKARKEEDNELCNGEPYNP